MKKRTCFPFHLVAEQRFRHLTTCSHSNAHSADRPVTCCNTFRNSCYQLTVQGISNYSGAMEADLKALEDKVSQLLGLCQQMRTENLGLRQELAQAQDEIRQLKENMALAGERLEALIEGLPEGMA